ncbi:predicted protein [Bathycoccus prasinos]|uniref:Uncharacterized protein n=1 Tax=Bathycoccus prasinos TaxID=41875 RepID=K8F3K9_9CHLO|nr:predicted protein [Bathycoccus prasinos]CCO66868.1 predicted protein [Bathycoccus prasinos]|eukprot:XP_007511308.1 predicted protein [Bathycoccus prasinos]
MLRGATSSSLSSKRLFVSSKKKENATTLSRRKRSAFTTTSASSNMGKDFVESFFDVADFLSGASSFGTSELAENIGRDCYVDVNGWHLFLKDMKPQGSFHQGLANVVIGTIVKNGKKCSEEDMTEILKTVKVPLGEGKMEASLFDLMPKRCVDDFVDIAKRYADDL